MRRSRSGASDRAVLAPAVRLRFPARSCSFPRLTLYAAPPPLPTLYSTTYNCIRKRHQNTKVHLPVVQASPWHAPTTPLHHPHDHPATYFIATNYNSNYPIQQHKGQKGPSNNEMPVNGIPKQ